MKTTRSIALALLIGTLSVGLVGCKPDKSNYEICVENGGDYTKGAWGEFSCDIPPKD